MREGAPRWFEGWLLEGRGLEEGAPSIATSTITRRISPHSGSNGQRDVRQSLSRDVRQSLSRDVRQSLSRDVRQSLSRDVRQSLSRDVRQSLSRDVRQSLSPRKVAAAIALALVMLPAAPASATPPASESQAAVLARMGDEARVAGRFTEAEASYRAALAIAPCDRTELSLALALAAQGKAREAAPILARVLRKAANETPGNPPQGAPRASPESGPRGTQESAPREAAPAGGLSQTERERAARALADAQRELATITVDADVPGALVEVDGAQVGMSPLTEPVFVGPGRHTVRAARDGHQASQAVFDAEVGRTYAVHLALPRDATADSAPGAGPQADARDARRAAGRAGPRSLPEEVSPPAAGSYLSGPGGAVRAAGITLTAAGVLAGVSALVAAEVKSSHLAGQSAALGQDPGKCWEAKGAVAEACARLESGIAARDTMATAASVLFAGSGVAAAATFLSFFLLPPSRPVGTRLGGLDFTLSPHAGPRGGGVSLEASW